MGFGFGFGFKRAKILEGGIASPLDINGCIVWFDPNQETAGTLATITDRSGNANDATTLTSSATIVDAASPNGLTKVLRFNGAPNYSVPEVLARPYTMAMLYKPVTGNAGRTVGGGSTTFVFGALAVNGRCVFCNPGFVLAAGGALDVYYRLYLVAEAGQSTVYLNGAQVAQTADVGNPGTSFQIGSDNNGFKFSGDISEFITYDFALSPAQITELDIYLQNRHQI